MQTVIIGSGNVAYHLVKAFKQNNIEIHQIFGRNEIELSKISDEFDIPFSKDKLEDAELYIIAVSDSAVENVSELIKNENALVAHTSGSLPMEILKGNYRKASFYPLQTFSKTKHLDYSKKFLFSLRLKIKLMKNLYLNSLQSFPKMLKLRIMKKENTSI